MDKSKFDIMDFGDYFLHSMLKFDVTIVFRIGFNFYLFSVTQLLLQNYLACNEMFSAERKYQIKKYLLNFNLFECGY